MKKKPMQEWSREEMETWLKGTQGVVISRDGIIKNKMCMDIDITPLTPEQEAEWKMYLEALEKEEREIKRRKTLCQKK
jgi:hypothetical protein